MAFKVYNGVKYPYEDFEGIARIAEMPVEEHRALARRIKDRLVASKARRAAATDTRALADQVAQALGGRVEELAGRLYSGSAIEGYEGEWWAIPFTFGGVEFSLSLPQERWSNGNVRVNIHDGATSDPALESVDMQADAGAIVAEVKEILAGIPLPTPGWAPKTGQVPGEVSVAAVVDDIRKLSEHGTDPVDIVVQIYERFPGQAASALMEAQKQGILDAEAAGGQQAG